MSCYDGAGNEARTRYLHLGKVALYQMSYARENKVYCNKGSLPCQVLPDIFYNKFFKFFKGTHLTAVFNYDILIVADSCRCGGIGRHRGLKIPQ